MGTRGGTLKGAVSGRFGLQARRKKELNMAEESCCLFCLIRQDLCFHVRVLEPANHSLSRNEDSLTHSGTKKKKTLRRSEVQRVISAVVL